MVNDFNHKCSHAIAKKLITSVLKELDVIGITPFYSFFPFGYFISCGTLTFIVIFIVQEAKVKRHTHTKKGNEKVGIIGGIGPESSIEYYRLIIKRFQDRLGTRDYPEMLIHSIDMTEMLDYLFLIGWLKGR